MNNTNLQVIPFNREQYRMIQAIINGNYTVNRVTQSKINR